MRHDSTEFVLMDVETPDDITGDVIEVGFVEDDPDGIPVAWFPAVLDGATIKILIGPDGVVELTPGFWYPIVRIDDNPELPIMSAGSLRIT